MARPNSRRECSSTGCGSGSSDRASAATGPTRRPGPRGDRASVETRPMRGPGQRGDQARPAKNAVGVIGLGARALMDEVDDGLTCGYLPIAAFSHSEPTAIGVLDLDASMSPRAPEGGSFAASGERDGLLPGR